MAGAAPTTPVRVLLGDGHPLYLEALRSRLTADHRFEILGATSEGAEAVRLAHELRPDLVLLDAAIPGDAVETMRQIRSRDESVRVLIMVSGETGIAAAEAQEAGAAGFLPKDRSAARALATIYEVSRVVTALGELSSS
jgi:DNA-binding NarL/FixJ family response regulator